MSQEGFSKCKCPHTEVSHKFFHVANKHSPFAQSNFIELPLVKNKANFPLKGNDSICFIKQGVKPEIKILDNILCSWKIQKNELLLKVMLSHLFMKHNTPADLFHMEKVFPLF